MMERLLDVKEPLLEEMQWDCLATSEWRSLESILNLLNHLHNTLHLSVETNIQLCLVWFLQ